MNWLQVEAFVSSKLAHQVGTVPIVLRYALLLALVAILPLAAFVPLAAQQKEDEEDPFVYEGQVTFPPPTPAYLDSLKAIGVMPVWVPLHEKMYWPRSRFTIALRGTYNNFMSQAITGGSGAEANIAIPMGPSDYGLYLFARANYYSILKPSWLRWDLPAGTRGVLYNGGAGFSFDVPLAWDGFSLPMSMGAGLAFFQPEDSRPAETYFGLEPGIGVRYRLTQTIALQGLAQGAWLMPTTERNRGLGTWNLSIGFDLALAPFRQEVLQRWVPPLVVSAHDVVILTTLHPIEELNILDRNLDFINTELKPLTGFSWYYLGFRGIVRGTVVSSSRAASGNVTALDIRLDSADERGFRVWRTNVPIRFQAQAATDHFKSNNPADSAFNTRRRQLSLDKIAQADYAQRTAENFGTRYLRAELFPEAKGPLDQVPKVGSRVVVTGELAWDGDGHLEIHPRRPSDVKLINGEFLDSDDDIIIE